MLKRFLELYQLDLSNYISKKPVFKYDRAQQKTVDTGERLDYLSWPDVLLLLYQNGAERVRYGNCTNRDGHSLFLSGGGLPEVRVWVEVDGDRQELTYPIIDGTKDISMEKIVQSDVHNATQRGFVKCVAVNWGLGLSLWQKEEKARPLKPAAQEEPYQLHRRIRNKANLAAKRLGGQVALEDAVGVSEREIKKLVASCGAIDELEEKLDGVIHDTKPE